MNQLVSALPGFLLERKFESLLSSWGGLGDYPIAVELWNGHRFELGKSPKITLRVRTPKAVARLLKPSLGSVGSAYVEGELDVEGHIRDAMQIVTNFLSVVANGMRHGGQPHHAKHTRKLDAESIEHHYDVSNEFYGLWLDERMVYSCAYFHSMDDSLDQAQVQKIDHILPRSVCKQASACSTSAAAGAHW
jgi:cyclopropane-fatty-acyl-phospholipid synthase